jgi:hypothetical protein
MDLATHVISALYGCLGFSVATSRICLDDLI